MIAQSLRANFAFAKENTQNYDSYRRNTLGNNRQVSKEPI